MPLTRSERTAKHGENDAPISEVPVRGRGDRSLLLHGRHDVLVTSPPKHDVRPSAPRRRSNDRRVQIVALALRHTVPSVSGYREFGAGGLMSYGTSETDYYRLVGICAGKILSGEKPADLSVMQSTKFDFSQRRICP